MAFSSLSVILVTFAIFIGAANALETSNDEILKLMQVQDFKGNGSISESDIVKLNTELRAAMIKRMRSSAGSSILGHQGKDPHKPHQSDSAIVTPENLIKTTSGTSATVQLDISDEFGDPMSWQPCFTLLASSPQPPALNKCEPFRCSFHGDCFICQDIILCSCYTWHFGTACEVDGTAILIGLVSAICFFAFIAVILMTIRYCSHDDDDENNKEVVYYL